MKPVLFLTSLLICSSLLSQNMVLHDPVSARVFSSERYTGIKGTPFLFDKWMAGSATIAKGFYSNLELKLDAYSNVLYFNKDDEPWEFQDEVKSFVLMPKIADSSNYMYFKKGISGAGLRADQFVRVLTEGQVSLYKADTKLLTDVNEINRGVVKTFGNATKYFVIKNNSTQQINLTKKEVFEILKDKEDKIQTHIKEAGLSTKKESDLIAIVKYYNSI